MKLKCLISALLIVCLVLGFSLPSCAPPAEEEVAPPEEDAYENYVASLPEGCFPVPRDCYEQAMQEGELIFYNWAEYWPEELFEGFAEEFGIKVTFDYFASNAEAVTKFKLAPEIDYTASFADQRSFWQMNALGVCQDLTLEWIPNVQQYTPKWVLENPETCSERWIPYESYMAVYGYNTKYVDDPRIPSYGVLLEPDEQYRGRVAMVEEMFDVTGAALKYLGYSFNSDDENELMEAEELLLRQKPYVMAYEAWPKMLFLEEEAWIGHTWTGDAYYFHGDMPYMEFVLPSEGTNIGFDGVMLPKGSSNPAVAHLFFNYIFRPQVYGILLSRTGYSPFHTGAAPFLDEDVLNWLKPSEEYLEKCDVLSRKAYLGKGLALRSAIWEKLKG